MGKNETKRKPFDPQNVPLKGSLGLLALGDIGFEAWRKVRTENIRKKENEKE